MKHRGFECPMCMHESLQPLLDSVDSCEEAARLLLQVLGDAKHFIGEAGSLLIGVANSTLSDATALYLISTSWWAHLDAFIERWEGNWLWLGSVVHCTLVATGCLGVATLLVAIFVTLCGHPYFRAAACCTSLAWCSAYALTFGLLLQSIPLLASGLFAHDAHGLLSAVLTPLGVELYRDCIFGNLTMRQRGLLAQCVIITSAAEGNSSIAGFTTAN